MSHTKQLRFNSTPKPVVQYARALFVKGSREKDIQLPDLEAIQDNVQASTGAVDKYARLCGFQQASTLPVTYPHMMAFPLQMELMLHPSFPLALMGLVHIKNSISQHRAIQLKEKLDMRCYLSGGERTDKGFEFNIKSEALIRNELVWESESRYLSRLPNPDKPADNKVRPRLPVFERAERWVLAADLGRRYAAISGDFNPIHLYALTARLFGFKSQIAHGMWSKARTAAALQKQLGTDACTMMVEFKLPVFLPAQVDLNYTCADNSITFDLRDLAEEKVHLKGLIEAL